jgi:hypothetical protein
MHRGVERRLIQDDLFRGAHIFRRCPALGMAVSKVERAAILQQNGCAAIHHGPYLAC